jgi:predicted Zn-dependent peptidase
MPVTVKTYSNGFRTVYEKSMIALPLTTLHIFCDAGSVHECDGLRGACHLIEHMCFKGTPNIKSKEIFQEYSKIGAYFNAYTEKRYTCYTVKCEDKYVHHCLTILADMLLNSTFNEKEFNKEEKVVVEENNNNENDLEIITEDSIDEMLYQGSSYECPVDVLRYHTPDTLKYKDVVKFYHTFYHPDRMFLSIVSNLSSKEVDRIVKNTLFTKRAQRHGGEPVIHHGIRLSREPQYKLIEKRGVSNTEVRIGFRTCGRDSKDKYALNVLSRIMGNGLNGRLMVILREQKGLVYGAVTSTDYYEHLGDFVFNTKTRAENLFIRGKREPGVLPLLFKIIDDMIKKSVTKEELETAKGNYKGAFLMGLQDIVVQTRYNGEELIFRGSNDILSYRDIYETYIKGITLEDIRHVIQKYFIRENMCICILGEKLPSLDVIKRVNIIR